MDTLEPGGIAGAAPPEGAPRYRPTAPGDFAPDLDRLLVPISPERPAGESLRYEGTYDRIREARREDDPSLPQGVWQRKLKRAEWPAVQTLCVDALTHRTKDLQIAAWLLEAWIRLHGHAGLHAGFALLASLCDRYWDDLHPEIEGGDTELRTAPIDWVDEKLVLVLQEVAISRPTDLSFEPHTWLERKEALRREHLGKRVSGAIRREDLKGEGLATRVEVDQSVTMTPREFYEAALAHLEGAQAQTRALEALLDARCGARAPSLVHMRREIGEIRDWVAGVLAERPAPAPAEDGNATTLAAEAAGDPMTMQTIAGGGPAAGPAAGPIRTRADAYRQLAEAAAFLSRTEPHSPTPYLVRRAVAWGDMTLSDLMRHFLEQKHDLRSLQVLLGLGEEGK